MPSLVFSALASQGKKVAQLFAPNKNGTFVDILEPFVRVPTLEIDLALINRKIE